MKAHLKDLKRERAGTYRNISKGLFLDRNERVVPFSEEARRELGRRLSSLRYGLYPELGPFYNLLADWLKVEPEKLYVTEGVSGAIKSIVETVAEPGDNIVFPTPTFALYPVYGRMFQQEVRTAGYKRDYKLDFEALLNSIDGKTSVVFLPNPNMPISGTVGLDAVRSLAIHCAQHGALLVVDEVYYPFGGPTAIGMIDDHANLLVARSFSKAYGMAGVRVGYVAGNPETIDYISKTRSGYETNAPCMEIVRYFIENDAEVLGYIDEVKNGLAFLRDRLTDLGLEHDGGVEGNFVFVNLYDRGKVEGVVRKLKKRDIYIRGGWPTPYDGGFSVTGAPPDVMAIFWDEFQSVYESAA